MRHVHECLLVLALIGCRGTEEGTAKDGAPKAAAPSPAPAVAPSDDTEKIEPAQSSASVAGAFLQCADIDRDVAFGTDAEHRVGCTVFQTADTKAAVAVAQGSVVNVKLQNGETLTPTVDAAPAESPWTFFFTLAPTAASSVARLEVVPNGAAALATDNLAWKYRTSALFNALVSDFQEGMLLDASTKPGITVEKIHFPAEPNAAIAFRKIGAKAPTPPPEARHLFFATDFLVAGDFGPFADLICAASGKHVDPAREYRAVFGAPGRNALEVLAIVGPVYTLGGAKLGDDAASFWGSVAPLATGVSALTESGFDPNGPIPGTEDNAVLKFVMAKAWSGMTPDGGVDTARGNCDGWTSRDPKGFGTLGHLSFLDVRTLLDPDDALKDTLVCARRSRLLCLSF